MSALRAVATSGDQSVVAAPTREFAFSNADFQTLTRLAYDYAGIALAESKQNLIYSRLSRRLRALRLNSFRDYCDYLAANVSEIENFINSISTNHTKFFREAHHFDHFRSHVAAPFAQAAARKSGQRLRVWSAGCSSGEEPYTIAVVLHHEIRDFTSPGCSHSCDGYRYRRADKSCTRRISRDRDGRNSSPIPRLFSKCGRREVREGDGG